MGSTKASPRYRLIAIETNDYTICLDSEITFTSIDRYRLNQLAAYLLVALQVALYINQLHQPSQKDQKNIRPICIHICTQSLQCVLLEVGLLLSDY